MNNNHFLIVMAGGVGTRLWPFSRSTNPKQFHDVLGIGKSLLQLTMERFDGVIPRENMMIVTNEKYKSLVQDHLPWMEDDQILLEPIGKNTAPCIAYAGYKILSKNPDASVVVSPADHYIANIQGFKKVISEGLDTVDKEDLLLTLGIRPTRPDTGYGYIQYLSEKIGPVNKVKTFTEKPELALAEKFLESGDFVWNSGIFLWNLKTMRQAFQDFEPELHELFQKGDGSYYTAEEKQFIQEAFHQCKSISIDYAIMEKADRVYTYLSDFGWSDLGTWGSLYETATKDEGKNAVDAMAILDDSKGNIVKSSDKNHLIVTKGLNDFIVAQHDGVTVICPKKEEGYIKQVLKQLKEEGNTAIT